ncbi:MAG TPA: hypothetical protein VK427_17385 [Kofleriaceae bacterium]|nr:hypothetical protein [Kofleriaceae bacterium]
MKTSALAVLVVVACGKTEPANEGKRLPAPPPAKRDLPADLQIDVVVDGVARPPITHETLTRVPPDFTDAQQRKAWRIARLVGAAETPETAFAITGTTNNITVEFPAMQTQNPLVPALSLSQRGQMIVEFVDPKDPFPRFHGEGGRLGRSPESEPRVSGVTRIEVKRR